jgi:hypothetical protein
MGSGYGNRPQIARPQESNKTPPETSLSNGAPIAHILQASPPAGVYSLAIHRSSRNADPGKGIEALPL